MTEIILRELTADEVAEREAYDAGAHDRAMEDVRRARQNAYQVIADPLFFKWQAGQGTEKEWLDARKQVDDDNPYPAK